VDDGKGFTSKKAESDRLRLISMEDRAKAIGATLHVTSEPGRTCVEVRVPGNV
jgi:signal transduction histidine kinase